MITIINATNRPGNKTELFSKFYLETLLYKGISAQLFSLESLNTIALQNLYDLKNDTKFIEITHNYIKNADKLIFVTPEYNGSYTGVLKWFIDSTEYKLFKDKKIALVGISTGRAGNLRGLDELTNIFNYLEAHVLHYKIPISGISEFINNEKVTDKAIKDLFDKQINLFLDF